MERVLIVILIGLAAGFLAGMLMKGRGFGVVGDIIVGILGAVIGSWVFSMLGVYSYGFIGTLIVALVGAMIFLALISVVKRV